MTSTADVGLPHLDADRLRAALPITDAIDALERAFGGDELPETPVRSIYNAEGGELLLMPAWGRMGLGVKLVTLERRNSDRGLPLIHGVFVLFAAEDKQPLATVDGAALTAIRTAAVSALGTRHLARHDARSLVIFGAGRQARAHLDALLCVRDFERVAVVDLDADRARELAEHAERCLGVSARVGEPGDVADADVICCCTTSTQPVVQGELLAPGTHIVAMGAYRPDMREVDAATLQRARVVVESRAAALEEAGDLLIPIAAGQWSADRIDAELADVVRGPGRRRDDQEITLFKTVGLASEDLVVAHAAVERMRNGLADPDPSRAA
ncbi:MAG: ornithine cyclodeaminase [Conexibacter sp.]|nr:ornithine cyclodeaminase [Conexibacter sp.]